MADGQFVIQRYWGSEDEDSSTDLKIATENSLEESTLSSSPKTKSKRKRKHVEDPPSSDIKQDNINQNLNNDPLLDVKQKTSYKIKKSQKRYSNTELENNQMTPKSDDCNQKEVKLRLKKSKNIDSKNALDISNNKAITNDSKESKLGHKKRKNSETDKSKSPKIESSEVSEKLELSNKESDSQLFIQIGQVKRQSNEINKPILPKWLSKPTIFGNDLGENKIPITDFQYLDEVSKKNLEAEKIAWLFPVQAAVIPHLMWNNLDCLYRPSDLCISAPTGSGKTLTFVLPIVQSLKTRVVSAIRTIVVVPVSELAFQVHKVFGTFLKGTDLKCCLLTGHKSFVTEQKLLVQSRNRRIISLADIVVTTPGRILDHIHKTEGFCLKQLRYLVIDEADRLMEEFQKGWLKEIEEAVYGDCNLPSCVCSTFYDKRTSSFPDTAYKTISISQPLQKLLFSATLSHDPEKLHTLSLYKPQLFIAEGNTDEYVGKCSLPESLTIKSIVCKGDTKPMVLCHFLKENNFKKVLCFTESIERAERLHLILKEMNSIGVLEMSSNYRPVQRKIILEQFNNGKANLLICSDLVARGMDFEGIDCVISYDVPNAIKSFVHRIGRTARAGKSGMAIALLKDGELTSFKRMLQDAGIPVPKEYSIAVQELEIYVDSFKKSLEAADFIIRGRKYESREIRTK